MGIAKYNDANALASYLSVFFSLNKTSAQRRLYLKQKDLNAAWFESEAVDATIVVDFVLNYVKQGHLSKEENFI